MRKLKLEEGTSVVPLAKIDELEVLVYLKIFGLLQFRLFSGFFKTAWGNSKFE